MQENSKRVTVAEASEKVIGELRSRNVTQPVIRKFEILLQERLEAFSKQKGIRWLDELNVEAVRDFRSTWTISDQIAAGKRGPLGALTAAKYLERLKQFFKFCLENEWVARNPAAPLKPAKIKHTPTMPLSDEGYASDSRWDGNDRLFLYTQKAGTPVHLPLPPELASRLRSTVNSNPRYFFWSGVSDKRTVTTNGAMM